MAKQFSVVSPMYNVARYLPDYFASLESQSLGIENLDIVLVDDGSTDETLDVARAFAARHPASVRVIHQENGGQASARNTGLTYATGEWVTFPDPDDTLSPHYFAQVADAIGSFDAQVYSARMLLWYEKDGSVRDNHALRWRFGEETHSFPVDLTEDPRPVVAHVTTGFFRRAQIERIGLRFSTDLRLRFEDGNFVSRYLLAAPDVVVGFVPRAEYHYRQREDQSSTIQSGVADPRKYVDTLRYGFVPILDETPDPLPRWLENLFLYDVLWIFRSSLTAAVRRARFPAEMYEQLDELMPQVFSRVSPEAIEEFDLMPVSGWMRDTLAIWRNGDGHADVHFGGVDKKRGLVSLVYRFRGPRPVERIMRDGADIAPRYEKDYALEYVGRPVAWQRTLWVSSSGSIRIFLDGVEQQIRMRENEDGSFYLDQHIIHARLHGLESAGSVGPLGKAAERARTTVNKARTRLRRLKRIRWERVPAGLRMRRQLFTARTLPGARERFSDAWVFIDRDTDANDSAEIMYRWVQRARPEVNSWFVVRKGTADWDRLAAEGFRLVAYGTSEYFALLLNAKHVISSHADRFITHPFPQRYARHRWMFTFLQHGVIKGDISGWLNPKRIHVFVTSTEAEYSYIAGPGPYRYSRREVRLTGLPRFDELLRQAEAIPPDQAGAILVMPTWRDYLVGAMVGSSKDRDRVDGFSDTEYAQNWGGFLRAPELAAAHAAGRRVVFMPHPNMHQYLQDFDVPSFVEVVGYDDVEVRDMIARSAVLVTDYSSTAFNMAYLQRPIVYFQFDQDEYFNGHTERPGYFEYERDGFGPVTVTVQAAVEATVRAFTGEVDPVYATRMDATFPVRDGRHSERVYEAIRLLSEPLTPEQEITAAPADDWETLLAPAKNPSRVP